MVGKNDLRAAFSARLHLALDDAGIRSRGRGVDVHNQLKRMGVYKTPQAVSKWLNGEAMAEADSMTALASWLKVRREWLEYGVLPKTLDQTSKPLNHEEVDQYGVQSSFPRPIGVPLIAWPQAHDWLNGGSCKEGHLENRIPCPVNISESGFALEVRGDSMTNPGPGRTYPPRSIIFVDPEVQATPGNTVIAQIPKSSEITFKILSEDAGRTFLRPINPQYPIIDITDGTHVYGPVIGVFIPE